MKPESVLATTKRQNRKALWVILARLPNHNATDDDNVDFRSFLKNLHSKLGCKVVDLAVQKLLNDMTLDWHPMMNSSLHTGQS